MLADEDPASFDARIEALTRELDASSDPDARRSAGELVRLILEFHGVGLRRVLQIVAGAPASLQRRLVADPVIASLMALHELEPIIESADANRERMPRAPAAIQISRRSDAPAAQPITPHDDQPSTCEQCGVPL